MIEDEDKEDEETITIVDNDMTSFGLQMESQFETIVRLFVRNIASFLNAFDPLFENLSRNQCRTKMDKIIFSLSEHVHIASVIGIQRRMDDYALERVSKAFPLLQVLNLSGSMVTNMSVRTLLHFQKHLKVVMLNDCDFVTGSTFLALMQRKRETGLKFCIRNRRLDHLNYNFL